MKLLQYKRLFIKIIKNNLRKRGSFDKNEIIE